MCGLIGGNNPAWNYNAAVEAMGHRGPDSHQVQPFNHFTLGFSRLAVVDTSSTADQPMLSNDGRVALAFNGETYGHRILRESLRQIGYEFRTHSSDTETVLNAYLHWGADFVENIDGMFAIAIYDQRTEQIHLYRDRAGVKPLYYFCDGPKFAFASELKTLQTLLANVSLTIDNTALYDFLNYGYIPAPKSLYRNIFKLPPATHLVFDVRQKAIQSQNRYWELPVCINQTIKLEEAADHVTELLEESVHEQIIADVPVGCFLSGGIDSSIVVSHAAKADPQLQTFSVGFEDVTHSETRFAQIVAEQFATRHHEVTYAAQTMNAQLSQLQQLYHEPFADTSAFPTRLVSKTARQSVTVALSGDGGDELFGGYKWYRRFEKMMRYGATRFPGPELLLSRLESGLPAGTLRQKATRAVTLLCTDPLSLYLELMGGPTRFQKQMYARQMSIDPDYDCAWYFRQFWRPELPLLTRLQYLDFHTYLPDDILTKVDRASMAQSLEVRVPFLSRKVIEFAFSLPENVRYCKGQLKGILKHAYRHSLPDSILQRSKKGFSVPPSHLVNDRGNFRETVLQHTIDRFPPEISKAS